MKRPLLLAFLTLSALLAPGLHAAEKSSIDPNALAPLKRMSTTLANATTFTYHSKNIVEVPAQTGQFITLFSAGEIAVHRPNKFRARLGGDAPAFDFYYDGATVSAFAPGTKVYSSSKAPATLDEMLTGLTEETGIRFASAPLLFSDPFAVFTRDLETAVVVGPTTIDGVDCNHLAFRSPGVNWEIWLEANARSLPRRLAVTFTDRPNFPRTIVDFTNWNLDPLFGVGSFALSPPTGATEIPFKSVLKSAGR